MSKPELEYRAVKLSYVSGEKDGLVGRKRHVDLTPVNELVAEGWEVHTFSFDKDGCWHEAILVRCG